MPVSFNAQMKRHRDFSFENVYVCTCVHGSEHGGVYSTVCLWRSEVNLGC